MTYVHTIYVLTKLTEVRHFQINKYYQELFKKAKALISIPTNSGICVSKEKTYFGDLSGIGT